MSQNSDRYIKASEKDRYYKRKAVWSVAIAGITGVAAVAFYASNTSVAREPTIGLENLTSLAAAESTAPAGKVNKVSTLPTSTVIFEISNDYRFVLISVLANVFVYFMCMGVTGSTRSSEFSQEKMDEHFGA